MKNLLATYLVAKASAAEADHKMEMRADKAAPLPILIAATYDLGDGKTCVNTAVSAAVLAESGAKTTLANREKDTKTKLEVEKQEGLKAAKDKAVTAKNEVVKAALQTDNAAQISEFDLKEKWLVAYRAWKAAGAAEAAQAKVIADLGKADVAAGKKKVEIDTSYKAAKLNWTRNDTENKAWITDNITAVEGVIKAEKAKTAQALLDNNNEKKIFLANQQAYWFAKVQDDFQKAVKVKVTAKTAALDKDDLKANAGTAKNLDDKLTLVLKADVEPRKQYDLDYTAMINALKNTKTTFKAWLDLDGSTPNYVSTSYTDHGTTTLCEVSGNLTCVAKKDEANAGLCGKECDKLPPWTMDATYTTLPKEVTAFDGTDGPKTCTGYEHKSNGTGTAKCKLCYGKQVAKKAGSVSTEKCFTRKKSILATIKAFTDKWAIARPLVVKVNTYWSDSYGKALGPLMKLNDISKQENTKLKALLATLTNTTISNSGGAGTVKAMESAKSTLDSQKNGAWATKSAAYIKNLKDIEDNTEKLALNKYRGAVYKAEVDSDKKVEVALKKELDAVTVVIGYNGTTDKNALGAVVKPGSGLKVNILTQTALKTCVDNKILSSCSGTEKTFAKETADKLLAEQSAEAAYEKQIGVAKGTAAASLVTANLSALNALLKESAAFVAVNGVAGAVADGALTTANKAYAAHLLLIKGDAADLAAKTKAKLAKIVTCEAEKYNEYVKTLNEALAKRKADIKLIVGLLDARVKPAKGAKNWRCEKALSNGTFRPTRGEKTCVDGLCCGAAKVVPNATQANVVMTIETCQTKTDKTYAYIAPRLPLDTKWATPKSVPFACISGAQKLVTAASALAAAAYMMA